MSNKKDFYRKIYTGLNAYYYINNNGECHKLNGAADVNIYGKLYSINGNEYLYYSNYYNELRIYTSILKIQDEYIEFIIKNINDLLSQTSNIKFSIVDDFDINKLHISIKNFLII